ncbi:uncharacterized protein LOC100678793 [Nasonia vitripennis]|uniref:Uncharacterized protein n=1 Tax=Nasonia vitripennis TaxID=7425 RepID=A0A7M7H6U3_NASVI|nr:uncharacterized protein LOC100678793 [Nasonia vitripennis]
MATRFSILLVCALLAVAAQAVPLNTADAQTCAELCSSCKGVASFDGDRCECNIEGHTNEEVECVSRMKRQAEERGLNLLSCDLSSDKRSTRCTLGLKHKLGRNNIDQVAKYFMQDGPITGNIFRAPPLMGKSSDCVGAARIVTQPAETYELRPVQPQYIAIQHSYMDTQPLVSNPEPQQFVSSPNSDCVGAQQQPQMVSSPTPKQYSAPKEVVSSPPQGQKLSSPKSDDTVGDIHKIITQPQETMPESKEESTPQVSQKSSSGCGPAVGQTAPGVGAVDPLKMLGVPSITPTLLQILRQQLSHPMLGIPQAIQTISKTPGLNDLVSAPAHLLTGIAQRLGLPAQTLRTASDAPKSSDDDNVGVPKMEDSKPSGDCGSTLGSENPASNMPTVSYLNPGYGTQYISLFNPTVGAPWNPTVGAAAPGQISYMSPTVGAPAPTHISYVHQLPAYTAIPMIPSTMMSSYVPQMPATTYIVGSPMSMPFYNTASSPMGMQQSDTTLEETFKYEPDQHVGKAKPAEIPALKQQKKICKKSNQEEAARKITRDVKGFSESITDEELEKQSKMIEAANKQAEQNTTELPKIDRTTTQRPAIEKSSGQKTKVERSAARTDKAKSEMIGKIKQAKEITKKLKGDKKLIKS